MHGAFSAPYPAVSGQRILGVQFKTKDAPQSEQGLLPCAAKYPPPPPQTSCVPSDSVSQGVTASTCPLCCT